MSEAKTKLSSPRKRPPNLGVCKLTGDQGKLVKSHIIPKALTKPAYEGGIFWQAGAGNRPQRRRTSWYDQQIVTRKGEDILSDLDSWAIKFLRKNRLVWSGFGPVVSANVDIDIGQMAEELSGYGIRRIEVADPTYLRKFCLSLLWRASVSTLPEMQEVSLGSKMERKIARYLCDDFDLPQELLPCEMIQHHQVGFIHNQTPIKDTKEWPTKYGNVIKTDTYRFYFDGLVLHFGIGNQTVTKQVAMSEMAVGYSTTLHVTCVPWHRSREKENLRRNLDFASQIFRDERSKQ